MESSFLIVAGLSLLGLTVRTGYELLKKAGKVDPHNRAVFATVFVAMGVMLASWPVMGPRDPWRIALPAFARWIGLGGAGAGLALAIGGLVQLRGVENIDHLVTTGLYARLRHPIYLGFILWIFGWTAANGAILSLAVGLAAIANILYWRHLEERALESSYGTAYRLYRQATWF